MNNQEKKGWKYWLNEWDSHVSAVCFIVIGIMLLVQVVSRYLFNHSFTAMEEVATALFVLMTYSGVSSAVTHRKHLTISALPDALPFKARKILLIVDNLIFMGFCIYVIPFFVKYIDAIGNVSLPITEIPEKYFYWIIPIFLGVTAVRIVQDCLRLAKENEENLNVTAPSLDLDAFERIAQARKEADAIAAAMEAEKKGESK